MYRKHTSEVSCHLFVQAVELLPVFEPGGMWHGPVAGAAHHGGHDRRGRGCRATRQAANADIQINKLVRKVEKNAECFLKSTQFCVFYLLDPRSSSDEALFIPAGAPEASPRGEE